MTKHRIYSLLLILCPLLMYFRIIGQVGFLSDDFGIIHFASNTPIWKPLELHHYSLAINLLFKGVAQGILNAGIIHAVALVMHIVNSFLIFSIVQLLLKWEPWKAFFIALLFSINPAGLEALTWCCAIGYILSAFWILLAIYGYLQNYRSWLLILFQLMAFLTWDWGILLTPIILTVKFFDKESRGRYGTSDLILVLFWSAVFVVKKFFFPLLGYQLNSFPEVLKILVFSPFVALFPNLPREFYISWMGAGIGILFLAAITWICIRQPLARLFAIILLICLLPQALLSFPQSRYFYLAMFPLYVLVLFPLNRSLITVFSLVLLVFINFVWTNQRVDLWVKASHQMDSIRQELTSIVENSQQPLVVVNLPDRYGPREMIWLPFMWRFSQHVLPKEFCRINTPDCPNLHHHHNIPISTRPEIEAAYSDHLVYEVVYNYFDGFFSSFSLKKL